VKLGRHGVAHVAVAAAVHVLAGVIAKALPEMEHFSKQAGVVFVCSPLFEIAYALLAIDLVVTAVERRKAGLSAVSTWVIVDTFSLLGPGLYLAWVVIATFG